MAIKFGRCPNQDCPVVGKTQEADETDFVCETCGTPLKEQSLLKPQESFWRKRLVLAGSFVALLLIAGGTAFLLQAPAGQQPLIDKQQIAGTKSLQQWMQEFNSPPPLEPSGSDAHRQAWQSAKRLQSRAADIAAMKRAGKLIGSERGLLNVTATSGSLSATEQELLNQENLDRRTLYAFVSQHSNPPVSYEYVAYEYARNQWKEWPPKIK